MSNSALRLMSSPVRSLIMAASLALRSCFTARHFSWKVLLLANFLRPCGQAAALVRRGRVRLKEEPVSHSGVAHTQHMDGPRAAPGAHLQRGAVGDPAV
jgi:hypothetical protein